MYEIKYAYWSEALKTYTEECAVVRADSGSAAVEKLLADNPSMRHSDILTVINRQIVYL